jgi:dimethylsulfide dehydrogenase subunit alpha/complex iron-sulfur molybdoenzyme family reductase subunit alpha
MYDRDRLLYPMKRVGKRGEGKWRRLTWDQAAAEIADKVIDLYQQYGPGSLLATQGTGMQADNRMIAPLRFASLTGAVHKDISSTVGDLPTGVRLAYGRSWLEGVTTDRLFDADYILLSGCNPNVTRIPDAHFIWEAKYNGCRVVSMAPDYNPSSIHADLWLPVKQGTDPFVMMSLVHVVIKEQLVNWRFVKEQTDLPLLVRQDNQRLLRQSDLEENGSDEVFYFWDHRTQRAVAAPGSMGSADKTIALGDVEPALQGSYQVNGITVQPVYESVRREALRFSPESTADLTGVDPALIYQEARHIAAAKMAIVLGGLAITKYSNGALTLWAQALLLSLTGHVGPTGGVEHIGVGWKRPLRDQLSVPKHPRLEPGGLGEWLLGEHAQDAKNYFDADKLKQRLGYDIDDLQDMIDECLTKGWMPHWGQPKGMIVWGDNFLRRNKAARRYRERILSQTSALYVNINTRMDSSALWADYLLPAASHYEAWDLRSFGYHRFVNAFTAPATPLGESKPDWDITALLCQKIQERAKARGLGKFDDPAFGVSRDFDSLYDDFTMNGQLKSAYDTTKWLVEHSPELAGQSLEHGRQHGFLIMNDEAIGGRYTKSQDNMAIPFGKQVFDKEPYPTLSGRITFYIDHDWFLKLGAQVPTARPHAGRECSNYPLGLYSPHTRWGIHSNWRSNKYMMRLQRGEPHIYINPGLARRRGIADGGRVRVFNSLGEFYAQAKFYPSLPEDAIMMEHAWETYQFEGGKGLNDVAVPLLQPLEMVGDWGHLKFDHFDWSPNQLAHETGVDIENAAG